MMDFQSDLTWNDRFVIIRAEEPSMLNIRV